jgi:phenylalanyl-tRNA synthetase beta chain
MRVSLEWLSEYVDITGLKPEVIAEALTQSGLEVEEIEAIGPRFNQVVIGKIEAIAPHPQADRLRLVTVDLGEQGKARVVCGAPNVKEGIRIAFAMEGATVLNRKDGGVFTLGKATIRGVESAGMICSLEELGLETQFPKTEDGIWPLDGVEAPSVKEASLGADLATALGMEADTVLHVAPPANRGDLMSLQGVAREVAALFDRPLTFPNVKVADSAKTEPTEGLQILLNDSTVCSYYSFAALENIQIVPSPRWLARRLEAAGMRSINAVVDVTNYVMLETGQPLHAFDAQKLGKTGTLGVRRAKEGERLTTLDDVERALAQDSVLIIHEDRPVALAGLMGGESTEIDETTQSLILEAACFPSAMIRRSGKSVALRSEASARFERGVDASQTANSLHRAIALLQELAGASLKQLVASFDPPEQELTLELSLSRQTALLGLDIDKDTTFRILEKLGFSLATTNDNDALKVRVPSHRQSDVTRPIDLMEEVARIYGYDKIPYTLPQTTGKAAQTPRGRFLSCINTTMLSQGLHEVMTPSLIGPRLLEKTGFATMTREPVTVLNSHSIEHTQLRQTLLPGLLEVAQNNQAQSGAETVVWIYELGRTYTRRGKASERHAGAMERLKLSGLIMGASQISRWQNGIEKPDFFMVKGLLENLFDALGLQGDISFTATQSWTELHPGKSAEIGLTGAKEPIGVIGELHPARQEGLKLRQTVYLFELDIDGLLKAAVPKMQSMRYQALTTFPAVQRDMALLAPTSLSHQAITAALAAEQEPWLENVSLFDEYKSEQLGADNRSLAYRLTFRGQSGTLTESDVDGRLARLKKALTDKLAVQFR